MYINSDGDTLILHDNRIGLFLNKYKQDSGSYRNLIYKRDKFKYAEKYIMRAIAEKIFTSTNCRPENQVVT